MFKLNAPKADGSRPAAENKAPSAFRGQDLTLPLALEDGHVPGLFRNVAYLTTLLLVLFLVWASLGQIRELSVAQGQVIPSGSIKLVHHLEGGLVDRVFVHEGQLINKGEPLMQLSLTSALSDLKQLRSRRAYLSIQLARYEALITGSDLQLDELRKGHPTQTAAEEKLYQTEVSFRMKEREILESNIALQQSRIKSLRSEILSHARKVKLHKEEVERVGELHGKQLTTQGNYTQAQVRYENAIGEAISSNGELNDAIEKLAQARSQRSESEARALQSYTEQRSKVTNELAELDHSIVKQADRVKRLSVRAPIRGIVQELTNQSPGEVVKPGGLVAKIVPIDVDVFAEVRLAPKDAGHVHAGNEAELSISTYDPNLFGVVKGKVVSISPTTFLSEENTPYYKGVVSMQKNYVGSKPGTHNILPGMEVKASLVTGAKSLMAYFLKPVRHSLNTAFTER